jgi:hypothetical protein
VFFGIQDAKSSEKFCEFCIIFWSLLTLLKRGVMKYKLVEVSQTCGKVFRIYEKVHLWFNGNEAFITNKHALKLELPDNFGGRLPYCLSAISVERSGGYVEKPI